MNNKIFKQTFTKYLSDGTAFIFIIDFECNKPFICQLENAGKNDIYYDIKGNSNFNYSKIIIANAKMQSKSINKQIYTHKINEVIKYINYGDSYLLNLSFPSELNMNIDLQQIFAISKAPYKLLYKDKFTVFSPECFIKVTDNQIYTYPMKGTIDATIENAEQILLNNPKEKAEHNTIVDLMRNDISMIAHNVELSKYRYVEKIETNKNAILQTSSEIKGKLPEKWKEEFAENLMRILPAGSISGAPKKKTIEIIKKLELDNRGYYTGVFGIFDGINIDSAVMIRFIEQKNGKMMFRSGGGITSQSNADDEYKELLQKIYIPANIFEKK